MIKLWYHIVCLRWFFQVDINGDNVIMWDSPNIILAEDVFRCITLVIHQNRGIYWAFGLF